MNAELIEKIDSLRKDLEALVAQAKLNDAKKLADLIIQKGPWEGAMEDKYKALYPYMTLRQMDKVPAGFLPALSTLAHHYLKIGGGRLFEGVTNLVPRLIEDLDNLESNLRWLVAIADHMGCPVSELLRFQPPHPWFWTLPAKTAAQ